MFLAVPMHVALGAQEAEVCRRIPAAATTRHEVVDSESADRLAAHTMPFALRSDL